MLNKIQLVRIVKDIKADALYRVLVSKVAVIDMYLMQLLMAQDESRKMTSMDIFNMREQIKAELNRK